MVEFQRALLLKVTLVHEYFSCLLDYTNSTKLRKASIFFWLPCSAVKIYINHFTETCLHTVHVAYYAEGFTPPPEGMNPTFSLFYRKPHYMVIPPYIFPKPPPFLVRLFRKYGPREIQDKQKKTSCVKVISSFLQD